jgi:acetyl-CoA carboxylase biotin carboxylase subunit
MVVEGVKTTIPFQKQILSHKNFAEGDFNTGFVEKFLQEKNTAKEE